jgi:ATPase subunit of ABC transporter with duplicated ATPase domains
VARGVPGDVQPHPDLHIVSQFVVQVEKLLIDSHSADFMDEVCTNIIDLTVHKKLVYYGGNYTTYVRTKGENETNQMKAYAKQQEEIAHIKSEFVCELLQVPGPLT